MNTKADLAEIFRHIQELANSCPLTSEQLEELEFFTELSSVMTKVIVPGFIGNLVPLSLKRCSFEKAQVLAESLGFKVVGNPDIANIVCLSWSKGLKD